jgi:hypothetical protein
VGGHHVIVLQSDAKRRVGQGLDDLAFHLDCLFFRLLSPKLSNEEHKRKYFPQYVFIFNK